MEMIEDDIWKLLDDNKDILTNQALARISNHCEDIIKSRRKF